MTDIFDQLASDPRFSPPPQQAAPDIFDRLSTQQANQFQLPRVTEENHIRLAAEEIDFLESRNAEPTSALARQAIVDEFRVRAGLKPLLGRDHFAEALDTRNDNPFFAFSAGVNQSLARAGTSLLGTVAPETARELQRDVEATTGEAKGVAGTAGQLLAGGAIAAATLPAGGLGAAGIFGAQGFGGSRVETAEARAQGQEISTAQEFGAAFLTGAVEAASGFVTQRVATALGPQLKGLAPGLHAAFSGGGTAAARTFLTRKITPMLAAAGIEGAEEAAAQVAQNSIAKLLQIDPDRDVLEGAVQAGVGGAILSPFLGGVAGQIPGRSTDGAEQRTLTAVANKRPQAPPDDESLANQVTRLERELAEERRLARTDPLTDLPNRRGFEELEQAAFTEADGRNEDVAVVETDLANFKVLNDTLGHEVGDRVLVAEAEAIREAIRETTEDRPGDISAGDVGRVGGDEFPVRLRNVDDPAKADIVMNRANEIFADKVQEIVGDGLPAEAHPFIAWGTEIRAAGDTRESKALTEAAEQKVLPNKNRLKRERGIPLDREGLTKIVQGAKEAEVTEARERLSTPTFKPETVMEAMQETSREDVSILRDTLPDEDFVLVDVPTEQVDPGFVMEDDVNTEKLDAAQKGLQAGTPAPPIVAVAGLDDGPMSVLDGGHRTLAAIAAGRPSITAFVPRSVAEAKGLILESDLPKPPKPQKRTRAANRDINRDRVTLGLTRLEGTAREAWEETLVKAKEQRVPERALRLASQIAQTPRPMTAAETAGSVIRAAALKNEHSALITKIGKEKDQTQIQLLSQEATRVEQEFDLLSQALRASGTEQGRALAARRMTIDQDFALVSVLSRAKAAKQDTLTQKEQARLRKLVKELDQLNTQLEQVDDTKPASKPPQFTTKQIDDLTFQRDRIQRRIRRFTDSLRPQGFFERWIADPFNGVRAIMTSFDFSAVLRQGGFIFVSHPIRSSKSIVPMLKAFASERSSVRVFDEINNRPNAALYKQAGLFIASQDAALTNREETYMTTWAERIPGVKNSERAYLTFLNKMRADSFDAMVAGLAKNGEATATEARAIANFINVASGRGSLGSMERAAVVLNTFFFAPRYVASRFQLLFGLPLLAKGSTARTRKLVAQEYARYLAALATFYGLLGAFLGDEDDRKKSGVSVEFDPRSSDFGKVKIGNTRLDPLSGLAQSTVFTARVVTGQTKSTRTQQIKPLRGDKVQFGTGGVAGVVGRFFRTKLAPLPAMVLDIATGTNVVGEKVTTKSVIANALTPLSVRELVDVMKEQGVPAGSAMGLAGLLGVGIQTYETTRGRGSVLTEAGKFAKEGDWESATVIMDRWNANLPKGKQPVTLEQIRKKAARLR